MTKFGDRLALYGAFGDERNVATADAEVVEFAVGKAVQLVAGLTNAVPGADVADDIHDLVFRFCLECRSKRCLLR